MTYNLENYVYAVTLEFYLVADLFKSLEHETDLENSTICNIGALLVFQILYLTEPSWSN
jgi:hypothetical protein